MRRKRPDSSAPQSAAAPEAATAATAEPPDIQTQIKAAESFLATVNSVAQRIQALWISFISFGAYLTVTVLETTHIKLFLSGAVKLPLFNIDLPLTNFYLIAPAFFLIFHFYFLTQLILLTRTASAFEGAVAPLPAESSNSLRMRLDNSVFVQLIAGPEPERNGCNSWFIRLTAWLTVIWLPLGLLLLIQLQFLPYHHEWLTTFHRAALSLDLVMLWVLWPAYRRGHGLWSFDLYVRDPRRERLARSCVGLGARAVPGVLLLVVSWLIVVYPSEPLYSNGLTRLPATVAQWRGPESAVTKWILSWRVEPEIVRGMRIRKPVESFSITEMFLEPRVDYVIGVPRGFFSNTIVLPDKRISGDDTVKALDVAEKNLKPGEFKIEHSFRGRNLAQAILSRTDLRRSDFTGANLDGVNFQGALLDRSRFGCADRGAPKKAKNQPDAIDEEDEEAPDSLGCAQLNRARLDNANLKYADLRGAQLVEASFRRGDLSGALLDEVKADGANFTGARLNNVTFKSAYLRGASFGLARMVNAKFSSAHLVAANLASTFGYGAEFNSATMQMATLTNARLIGASFGEASLEGALFRNARLQGADLSEATIDLAIFKEAGLWRARLPESDAKTSPVGAKLDGAPYRAGEFESWRDGILKELSEESARDQLKEKLAELAPPAAHVGDVAKQIPQPVAATEPVPTSEPASETPSAAQAAAASAQYRLAQLIAALACNANGAPFVARRLIVNRRLAEAGPELEKIAGRLTAADREDCPGGIGLTSLDRARLGALVRRATARPLSN